MTLIDVDVAVMLQLRVASDAFYELLKKLPTVMVWGLPVK
jgi:hypothetical protein